MNLIEIKTEMEYEHLLDWIDDQFDKMLDPNSPDGEKVEMALVLIKKYEDEQFPIPNPNTQ